jgi:hypothetical protein
MGGSEESPNAGYSPGELAYLNSIKKKSDHSESPSFSLEDLLIGAGISTKMVNEAKVNERKYTLRKNVSVIATFSGLATSAAFTALNNSYVGVAGVFFGLGAFLTAMGYDIKASRSTYILNKYNSVKKRYERLGNS